MAEQLSNEEQARVSADLHALCEKLGLNKAEHMLTTIAMASVADAAARIVDGHAVIAGLLMPGEKVRKPLVLSAVFAGILTAMDGCAKEKRIDLQSAMSL